MSREGAEAADRRGARIYNETGAASPRMAPRGLLLPLLAALSALLSAAFVADVLRSKATPSACEMTYSWPVYTAAKWAPAHHKYALFRVDMKSFQRELSGVPVLFVPGHMGSYKQARSISRHLWDADQQRFDVFALDFAEEPTGLSGNLVHEQAAFLNDAVRALLKQYKKQAKSPRAKGKPVPDSVIIIAHSMGGIVTRAAQLLPNYKRRSIQHIVGLGVPYTAPPFPFDAELQAVYGRIQTSDAGKGGEDVVYVSIAGGHKDTLVHASVTAPYEQSALSVAALATAMPSVGTTVDHFCLLWCHQLLYAVAGSLHASIDNTTHSLIKDPSERLAIAHEFLFGATTADLQEELEDENGHIRPLAHRQYVQVGYTPTEYASYSMWLPEYVLTLLRVRYTHLIGIMYALSLYILSVQVAQWQNKFNLQATAASVASDDGILSYSSLLHPAAQVPTFIVEAADFVSESAFKGKVSSTGILGGVTAALVGVAAVAVQVGGSWIGAQGTIVLDFLVLYLYAIGLLYGLSMLLSAVRWLLVSRIVGVLESLPIHPWMTIVSLNTIILALGQVASFSPFELHAWDSSRAFALLVLASFVSLVLRILRVGGSEAAARRDHERILSTLFAVFWLSLYSWAGKLAYFASVAKTPPHVIENDILLEGCIYVVVFLIEMYVLSLSLEDMLPLPPTAFFGAATGQDSASLYNSSASASKSVKITAENCPKCVFEDAGPGAVLIEFTNRNTRRVTNKETGEVVLVGPTFRVVSCDCVYRFEKSRDFCDFCVRSCRLCGGGDGNFQQAAKYKEFLEGARTEVSMHGLVPFALRLAAGVLLTYGSHRPHYIFHASIFVSLVLIGYHVALRNPLEARRRKTKKTKKSGSKKKTQKTKKVEKESAVSTEPTAAEPPGSSTSSASKKKKKKKTQKASSSSTSTTNSASTPLIQEVDPSTLD